jgi:hypothetical protein
MAEIIKESLLKTKIGRISVSIVVYVVAQLVYNLGIEDLATLNYKGSVTLTYVSIGFLVFVWLFAFVEKKTIKPQNYKPQFIRFAMIGLGAWFMTESYTYLPASSVSLIQRSEIPLIIIVAFLTGKRQADSQVKFAVWVIIAIVGFVIHSEWKSNDAYGVGLAQMGVFCTIITFQLMQKSVNSEGEYTSFTVSGLSCIFYGLLFSGIKGQWQFLKIEELYIVLLVSLSSFIMFKCMALFYRIKTLEYARFPALIGSVLTLFAEQLHENDIFSLDYILIVVTISVMVYWLLFRIKVIDNLVVNQ